MYDVQCAFTVPDDQSAEADTDIGSESDDELNFMNGDLETAEKAEAYIIDVSFLHGR